MSEYSDQLRIENTNLEAEIKKKETDLRIYDRVNEYYSHDEVMVVYIQKMLTLLYIVIYFFFIFMGIILPWLISTDKLPLSLIIFLISAMIVFSLTAIGWMFHKGF